MQGQNSNPKAVSFATTAKMRYALHISDYTTSEIEATFYNRDDISLFREDAKITARLVESGSISTDMADSCGRGTEKLTLDGAQRRAANRRRSHMAVFAVQECMFHKQLENRIKELPKDADEVIAAAYEHSVNQGDSVLSAYLAGLSDERIARMQHAAENESKKATIPTKHGDSNSPRFVKVTKNRNLFGRLVHGAASA